MPPQGNMVENWETAWHLTISSSGLSMHRHGYFKINEFYFCSNLDIRPGKSLLAASLKPSLTIVAHPISCWLLVPSLSSPLDPDQGIASYVQLFMEFWMALECLMAQLGWNRIPKTWLRACPVSTGRTQPSLKTYTGVFSGMLGESSSASFLDGHIRKTTINAVLYWA